MDAHSHFRSGPSRARRASAAAIALTVVALMPDAAGAGTDQARTDGFVVLGPPTAAQRRLQARGSHVPPPVAGRPAVPPTDPGGRATPDRYVQVVDQDLRSVIAEYARQMNLTAQVGPEIRQKLTNARFPLDQKEFLAVLQQRYGVAAYVDGDTLVASGDGEMASRLLTLGDVSFDQLKNELKVAAIPFDERTFKYLRDSGAVMVTAPKPIVARIAGILDAYRSSGERDQVKVIRFGR